MERLLIRADDYVLRRQVFICELIDPDILVEPGADPAPFNMAGSIIRMTFKTEKTDPNVDLTDENAPIKADIEFDADGLVVGTPRLFRLPPSTLASKGLLHLTMDKSQTLGLPLQVALSGDMQVTDANMENLTIPVLWTIKAQDGYTNRNATGV